MASLALGNTTISKFDALRSRSNEEEERLQQFLRNISRSQLNINRSMHLLDKARTLSNQSA